MEQYQDLKIGEWVKGKLKKGELFHGYIHEDEQFSNIIRVKIVKSDNPGMEGSIILTDRSIISRLETNVMDSKEAVLNLIDLSLLLKDKEWFHELTNHLKMIHVSENEISSSNKSIFKQRQVGPNKII